MVSVEGLRIVRLTMPAGTAGGYHDLTALLADQAGRHNRMFRPDVLAGVTGGRGRKMREVRRT